MGKNYTTILTLLAVICISLSGCEEDKYSGTTGKLRLAITADGAVTDVTTRSSEESTPDAGDFSMAILQNDKVQASWDKLRDYDEDTTFPIGTYTLKAFYGDMEKEGFDSPYYEGSTNLDIKGGATTDVEVICKLANTKISIEYTDDFKNYFKTYSTTVKSEQGSEITFTPTETRATYVKSGRVAVNVTFTKASGGSSSKVEVTTIDALPQHHYHLLMDVDAGKAMLSVIFDRVTEEKPITLDISDKALNIKAPYFTLTGFEKTSNDANQWDGNLTEANKLSALLTSLGGFKKCILRTTSPNLSNSWPKDGFDLAEELSAEQQMLLDNSGIKLTGFGKNKDQMAIIDFTGVVPHLNITDENSTHLFYLQVTSTYGKISEEYVLNITTPKNFMLLPAAPVKMGATQVVLPVKLKQGDPHQVNLYYKNYGTWTPIADISSEAIDGKEGYYNFTAKNVGMGFVAKDFIAEYKGAWSSEVKVAVIVPNYTINITEGDFWAHEAILTIVPENQDDLSNIMKSIEAYYLKNGKWIQAPREKGENQLIITNLTAGISYQFKTTCDDGGNYSNEITGITEKDMPIPNAGFSLWEKEITYTGIQNGGRSTYASGFGGASNSYNDYVYMNVSYSDPQSWSTTNSLTVPAKPTIKNTWYMVPSVLKVSESSPHTTAIQLRNVAWNDQGATVSDNTKCGWLASDPKNAVQPPSNFKRSAGKIYLGTLDGSNEDRGITFESRPKQLTFSYKYIPKTGVTKDKVGGTINIQIQSQNGVILAEESKTLSAQEWTKETINISYIRTELKATKLKIMFTSSTFWSYDQNKENSNIETVHETDNSDSALKISVGSSLYLDDIQFVY